MLRDSILPFVALRYFPYDFLCVDLRTLVFDIFATEERPFPTLTSLLKAVPRLQKIPKPHKFAIVACAPLLIHFPDCFPPYRRCTPFAVKQAGSLFELKVLQKCQHFFTPQGRASVAKYSCDFYTNLSNMEIHGFPQ